MNWIRAIWGNRLFVRYRGRSCRVSWSVLRTMRNYRCPLLRFISFAALAFFDRCGHMLFNHLSTWCLAFCQSSSWHRFPWIVWFSGTIWSIGNFPLRRKRHVRFDEFWFVHIILSWTPSHAMGLYLLFCSKLNVPKSAIVIQTKFNKTVSTARSSRLVFLTRSLSTRRGWPVESAPQDVVRKLSTY